MENQYQTAEEIERMLLNDMSDLHQLNSDLLKETTQLTVENMEQEIIRLQDENSLLSQQLEDSKREQETKETLAAVAAVQDRPEERQQLREQLEIAKRYYYDMKTQFESANASFHQQEHQNKRLKEIIENLESKLQTTEDKILAEQEKN